jgi:hypothetical protein
MSEDTELFISTSAETLNVNKLALNSIDFFLHRPRKTTKNGYRNSLSSRLVLNREPHGYKSGALHLYKTVRFVLTTVPWRGYLKRNSKFFSCHWAYVSFRAVESSALGYNVFQNKKFTNVYICQRLELWLESKWFWLRCIYSSTMNYWIYGLCPPSRILNNLKT